MISRIQSSCKNGMKFEDAMTQALSEILQDLQVINEDTKKPRCRKGSVPAIWYSTVLGATEERTTTFKQSNKVMERRFSEITTSALSTMPALQSLEEETEANIEQLGLVCQEEAIQEDSADKQKEDVDNQLRRLINAPVRGTSERRTTPKQPKKEMERKMSVFTAPALSAMSSLQSLEEDEVKLDNVSIGLGFQDKVIEDDSADKQKEDEDIKTRRRISAAVRGTSETTVLKQPKKEVTFSVLAAPALTAMPSLQSLEEKKINIDVVDIGLGCQDKGIEEDLTEKQREDINIQPRIRRISAPVIGTSERKSPKQPKKKMRRKFSLFAAPALSATRSLQSLDEVDIDNVSTGLGCQDKVIDHDSAEEQRGVEDIQPGRRRISAPAMPGTSETKTLKQPKKKTRRKFSLFAAPALSATPSLKSLDEENISIDKFDIGLGYNDRAIERETKKQPRRRRVSAPARTYGETAETTTFKQLKKDLVRKMSRPTFLPDLPLSTMPWLADCIEDQMEKDFEPVEFNLRFLDDLMKSV